MNYSGLPMFPNFLFFTLKDPNNEMVINNNHLMVDIIEHGSQGLFAVLLIFIISKKEAPILSGYMIFISLFLLSYFVLWLIYFTVDANFTILMLMAVIPVIYFIIAEIWLHNLLAVVMTVIFGITHITITYLNYH
ncbi:hypothetical protein BKP56_06435 [Marinilactibacillus sp. 15R]|uniref:hypothetical protein n=1 Tax=Marinilactibacillus sp. 15R TaxID=1911586 RepID=UPI00090C8E3A|nr:hypothetical protein [Marinilactibacillus sp. 15R]API88937.1 hypothetical protein BKP56_06435 [Marinilactibacillus sp. 15R]